MKDLNNITNKIKIKLFIAFLKKKKCFNNFIRNYNSFQGQWFRNNAKKNGTFSDYVANNNFDRLINNAFSWERTYEGFSYYAKLDEALREYYVNLISKNIFNDIRCNINGKK